MIKSITFGQYFPAESVVHRLDARTKLLLTIGFIVMLFIPHGFIALGFAAVCILGLFVLSNIPLSIMIRSIRGMLPIIVFMGILNIFYTTGTNVIAQWWIFTVTSEGVRRAVFMVIRIFLLIISASLLTYTTSPIDLTDGLERLLSPLKILRIPVHDLAMIMTIALRFVPTLLEEADKIMSAQKARGADIDTGGLFKRIKALIPILIPLFISAIRRASDLATAMDCRCYNGGVGRTRMKIMRLHMCDLLGFMAICVFVAGVVMLNMYVLF